MIARQIRVLFGAYRRDDFADPEGFVLQLGAVLERYPDGVITEVTSPLTGIQRRLKFPPSIAEVVEACDEAVVRNEKLARYREMPRADLVRLAPPPPQPGCRANLFVSPEAPCYRAVVERTRAADTSPLDWKHDASRPGLWVNVIWMEQSGRGKLRRFMADDVRAMAEPPVL